jgi:predicted dehydrogenase
MSQPNDATRRDFLKTTVATAGALALTSGVHAAGSDVIKVGLIGCGSRGTGAAHNVLVSAPNVVIHAIGDAFEDRAKGCLGHLHNIAQDDNKIKQLGNKVDVPNERIFIGLDAYKKVIDSGANYIILTTPPGFRPLHLQAAVAAGKNIFTEKPVATDGTGVRKVLQVYEDAKQKGLAIAAGTQRRHQLGYLELMKRIHNGEIGELVGGRCYWMQGILWSVKRQQGWSDLVYQMRNWYNYTWICGDHIVEQHVHNLDVINWAFGKHPVRAVGMGGRSRTNPDFGHIFDYFAIDYEYPNGVHVLSMCRQINGCENGISEALVGTRGTSQCNEYKINGKRILTRQQDQMAVDPYVQEHTDLIESIRGGTPINELKNVAESTLTAIMGRMSAYTGKPVQWEQALNTKEDLFPANMTWDMQLPEPKVAVPGTTPLI